MLETIQYGICIKNEEGKIIALARERHDNTLIFDSPSETTIEHKKISLYPNAISAKRSALARIKHRMYISDVVLEELINSIGNIETERDEYMKMKKINVINYKEIKEYIDSCEISIKYDII